MSFGQGNEMQIAKKIHLNFFLTLNFFHVFLDKHKIAHQLIKIEIYTRKIPKFVQYLCFFKIKFFISKFSILSCKMIVTFGLE